MRKDEPNASTAEMSAAEIEPTSLAELHIVLIPLDETKSEQIRWHGSQSRRPNFFALLWTPLSRRLGRRKDQTPGATKGPSS